MYQFTLQSLLKTVGADIEIRSYSGRGMYGKACLGITGSHDECMRAIGEAIGAAHIAVMDEMWDVTVAVVGDDESARNAEQADRQFHTLVSDIMEFKQDSMGHDVVIYWPSVAYESDETDDNEDEDSN